MRYNLKFNEIALQNFLNKLPLYLAPFLPLAFLAGNVVTEITVAFTVILYFTRLYLTHEFDFMNERWVQIVFLFIIYLLARNLFLDSPWKAITLILHTLEFIFFALALAYWILVSERAHKLLSISLGAVLIFTIADTYLQYFRGSDLFGWTSNMANRLTGPFQYKRVGGFISYLMFPPLAVALHYIWKKFPHFGGHLLGLGILALILLVLLLTGERVTLIYFAVGYVLMLCLWRVHHVAFLRISLMLCATLLIIGSTLVFVKYTKPDLLAPLQNVSIYKTIKDRIFGNSVTLVQQGSESHYRQIWSRAYTIFTYAPLFGVGVHQFMVRCPDAIYGPTDNLGDRCGLHIHHFYLEFLTETGIVGFALIVTVFILLFMKIWSTRNRWDEVPLLFGLFIAYAISIWPLAPFRGFFQNWRAVMFWFIVGWMMAAIRTYKDAKNEKLYIHK